MAKQRAEKPNRFHTFLRRLRAGGRTNMYGAIPYLVQAFGVDREAAFRIVCEWIDLQEGVPAQPSLFDAAIPAPPAAPPAVTPAARTGPKRAKRRVSRAAARPAPKRAKRKKAPSRRAA